MCGFRENREVVSLPHNCLVFFSHCTRKATVNALQVFLVEMSRCKKMWMRRISSFSVSFNCLPSCHNLLSSIYNCPPATVTVNSGKTRDTGSVSLCKPRFIILHRDYAEAYCALYELDCGFHCASVDELLPSQKGQISGHCIYVYITIHPFP